MVVICVLSARSNSARVSSVLRVSTTFGGGFVDFDCVDVCVIEFIIFCFLFVVMRLLYEVWMMVKCFVVATRVGFSGCLSGC